MKMCGKVSYKALSNVSLVEELPASLPLVRCSALAASVLLDEVAAAASQPPLRFSALSSAILDQRRERETAQRRERMKSGKTAAVPNKGEKSKRRKNSESAPAVGGTCEGGERRRRRHPAGDSRLTAASVEDTVLEPLVGLRLLDEEEVEFRTLLECDALIQNCESGDANLQSYKTKSEKRGGYADKLRKISALSLTYNAKEKPVIVEEDTTDGFVNGVKTILSKLFSS